jgi:hypothetical protein
MYAKSQGRHACLPTELLGVSALITKAKLPGDICYTVILVNQGVACGLNACL